MFLAPGAMRSIPPPGTRSTRVEYQDFELRIARGDEGRYAISVLRSPAGETEQDTVLVLPSDAITLVRLFDQARRAGNARSAQSADDRAAILVVPDEGAAGNKADDSPQGIGAQLFNGVFSDVISRLYAESLGEVRGSNNRLRLKLRIDPPELRMLPWEFLFDSVPGEWVALQRQVSITRFVSVAEPVGSFSVAPPLRILAMVASPSNLAQLDADTECRHLSDALDDRIAQGAVELGWVRGETFEDLQRTLEGRPAARRTRGATEDVRGPWHVFHFIGHGDFDHARGGGVVALCTPDGAADLVPAGNLARQLGNPGSIRLVVLNSCKGAQGDATDRFSSTSELMLKAGIPAVVAMQFEISDGAAKRFAESLYYRLAEHASLEEAVWGARDAVQRAESAEASWEWGTPVLSMRSDDSRLFTFTPGAPLFPAGAQGRITGSWPAATTSPQVSTASSLFGKSKAGPLLGRRGVDPLVRLRDSVREGWIRQKLEPELLDNLPIDITLDVTFAGDDTGGTLSGAAPAPSAVSMLATRSLFRDAGEQLLVLGEPATGKTIALLVLLRELLAECTEDGERPIPVPFTLDSWAQEQRPLGDWMVAQLSEKFGVVKADAARYVLKDYRRIIPFLDGLDEVREDARAACVQAINAYSADPRVAGVVVSSRYREYVALDERLTVNAAAILRRLTPEAVLQCVAAGGAPYAALDRILRRDSSLQHDACAPLMLRLLMRAYRDLPVEQIEAESAETSAARRKAVLDAFVARQFAKARKS